MSNLLLSPVGEQIKDPWIGLYCDVEGVFFLVVSERGALRAWRLSGWPYELADHAASYRRVRTLPVAAPLEGSGEVFSDLLKEQIQRGVTLERLHDQVLDAWVWETTGHATEEKLVAILGQRKKPASLQVILRELKIPRAFEIPDRLRSYIEGRLAELVAAGKVRHHVKIHATTQALYDAWDLAPPGQESLFGGK